MAQFSQSAQAWLTNQPVPTGGGSTPNAPTVTSGIFSASAGMAYAKTNSKPYSNTTASPAAANTKAYSVSNLLQ